MINKFIKKFTGIFLILSCLVLPVSAAPVIPFWDDFDSQNVGEKTANWNGWTIKNHAGSPSNGYSKVEIINSPKTYFENKCVKVIDATDAQAGIEYTFPEQTSGTFTIELNMMKDKKCAQGIWINGYNSVKSFPPSIAVNFSGTNLSSYNGESTTAYKTNMEDDKWYKLKIVCSPATEKYDIYLDGVLIKSQAGFRIYSGSTAGPKVNRILLSIGSTYTSESIAYFDDFKVYTGTADPAAAVRLQESTPYNGEENVSPTLSEIKAVFNGQINPATVNSNTLSLSSDNSIINYTNVSTIYDAEKEISTCTITLPEGHLFSNGKSVIMETKAGLLDNAGNQVKAGGKSIFNIAAAKIMYNYTTLKNSNNVAVNYFDPASALTAEFSGTNFDSAAQRSFRGIVAMYRYGKLISVKSAVSNAAAYNNECKATITFTTPSDTKGVTLKMFSFDTFQNILPLSEVYERAAKPYVKKSAVLLSSRFWYTSTNKADHETTIEATKSYMTTDMLWGYTNAAGSIKEVLDLGVRYQGAINTSTLGETTAIDFEGNTIIPPWMTWGSPRDCINNERYLTVVKANTEKWINLGINGLQFDDYNGNIACYESWGGCFCSDCMTKFRQYIKDNFTAQQISNFGISNIDTFNYNAFLKAKYSSTMKTTANYKSLRSAEPLDAHFKTFQYKSTVDFHKDMRDYINKLAKKPFYYTNNTSYYSTISDYGAAPDDMFDFHIGETGLSNYAGNAASYARIPEAVKSFQVVSLKEAARNVLPLTYALGNYSLVPWDVWVEGTSRYFCGKDEIYDLYHFIRQYDYLFDDYEAYAKVGLVAEWDDFKNHSASNIRQSALSLLLGGVPYKYIIAGYNMPKYNLNVNDFQGLQALLMQSTINQFTSQDQAAIISTGLSRTGISLLDSTMINNLKSVTVTGSSGSNIAGIIRKKPLDANAPIIVHIVNMNEAAEANGAVKLRKNDMFGSGNVTATYYRPNYDPVALAVTTDGDFWSMNLPVTNEWGIVRLEKAGESLGEPYSLPAGYTGFAIGAPQPKVEINNYALKGGTGFNTANDSLAYSFRNIKNTVGDLSLEANIAVSGGQGGLMLRKSCAPNAAFAAVYVEGTAVKTAYRAAQETNVVYNTIGTAGGKIKITREGGFIKVYKYTTLWELISTITVNEPMLLSGVFSAGQASFTNVASSY